MNNTNTPKTSVIIPCYNGGAFLEEAVKSVLQNFKDHAYEIIITNDGSTDAKTLEVLEALAISGHTVLSQENKGPGAARNTAVKASVAPYLFFLDSDNRVKEGYIDKAIQILEANNDIGVVYGKPYFFGEKTIPRFITKAFDINSLLLNNYIDTCSVVRRQAWDDVCGFDEARVLIAHEDWEFWIRVVLKGWRFYFIDEYLFDYRISTTSLVSSAVEEERHKAMRAYVFQKHLPLFIQQYRFFGGQYFAYIEDKRRPLRSFIKYMNDKYFNR